MVPGLKTETLSEGLRHRDFLSSPVFWCLIASCGAFLFLCLPVLSLSFFLAGAAWEDYRTGYVSDGWSILLVLGGMAHGLRTDHLIESFLAVFVVLAIYGTIFFIARNSMGTGDIVLAASVSVWLEPLSAVVFVWIAAASASVAGIMMILAGRGSRQSSIPFCPFIAIGGVIAYALRPMYLPILTAWLYPA